MRIVVDLKRQPVHVGWGRSIHVCFGGPLARLEVNTAFEAFLHRVDNPGVPGPGGMCTSISTGFDPTGLGV